MAGFGCLGQAPYWSIEAVFEHSTTTLYTLKELSLFIVFLESTSKLITFSQRSIIIFLVHILFEFFTPVKLTEIQRRISLLPDRIELMK